MTSCYSINFLKKLTDLRETLYICWLIVKDLTKDKDEETGYRVGCDASIPFSKAHSPETSMCSAIWKLSKPVPPMQTHYRRREKKYSSHSERDKNHFSKIRNLYIRN
jgi:hypothetical protein